MAQALWTTVCVPRHVAERNNWNIVWTEPSPCAGERSRMQLNSIQECDQYADAETFSAPAASLSPHDALVAAWTRAEPLLRFVFRWSAAAQKFFDELNAYLAMATTPTAETPPPPMAAGGICSFWTPFKPLVTTLLPFLPANWAAVISPFVSALNLLCP